MTIFETPQWVCWSLVDTGKPKPDKVPTNPFTGHACDPHDLRNWMDYQTASSTGLSTGFVLTENDPYFLLDLDNCRDPHTGAWQDHALHVAAMLPGAYCEVSTSGTGMHIIGRAHPLTNNRNRWRDENLREYEFYQSGRFVALGDVSTAIGDTDVDCTQALSALVPLRDFDADAPLPEGRDPEWCGPEDDDTLITMMLSARDGVAAAFGGGPTLRDLWEGNADAIASRYPSESGNDFDHSSADGALMAHLAFWTGKDQARMDRLFRRSALMRDKYEVRPDYRHSTVTGAARACQRVLNSPKYAETSHGPLSDAATALAVELRDRVQFAIDHEIGLPQEAGGLEVPAVDADILNAIITRTFWRAQGAQCFALKSDNTIAQFGRPTLAPQLKAIFGDPFAALDTATRKYLGDILGAGQKTDLNNALRVVKNLQWPKVMEYIERESQASSERHRVDLFTDSASVRVKDAMASVVLPWRPFEAARPVEDIDQRVVDEYKRHFPEFEDVIRFIVAARVADVRKASHLWLKAPSDWGKGLFINLFKPIGAAALTNPAEISKMIEGNPSGKTPGQFLRTLTLVIDEFKRVTSEIKMIDEDISFAPKNALQVTVPLYSKLYFSAEHVSSLAGDNGVEDQFVNRFCFIEGHGKIDDLPYRSQVGQDYFDRHIRQYTCNFINAEIVRYIAVGREQASRIAGDYVRDFHNRHSIAKYFGNLNDSFGELADSFKQFCVSLLAKKSSPVSAHVAMHEGVVYVKAPGAVWDDFINTNFPKSERGMVGLKKNDVFRQESLGGLDRRGRPPLRWLPPEVWGPDTVNAKCLMFTLTDPSQGAFGSPDNNVITLDTTRR